MSKNQKIVKINGYKIIQLLAKHMVYKSLKHRSGISEAKRENYEFVEPLKPLKKGSIGLCWFYS